MPAACNCAQAHSSSTSPTFASLQRSLSANSSISRRKSRRTRRLICAFHSPVFQSPVAGEPVQSLRALAEQSSHTASLIQLHETPLQENFAQIAEQTFLLLCKRNHFCPQNLPAFGASPQSSIRPSDVRPLVVMFENYVVARGHIRKIRSVQIDARTVGDGEALPISEPHGEKKDAFLNPVRNPVHFLAANLAVSFPQFSCFFLIRLSGRLCSDALISFIGMPTAITALGFFLGMGVRRHCALDTRSGSRRTI
jgi:hypothetical protein